tara:strand:- start:3008 stop:5215 length:2208 start_codon:yes stop_codon:yes gene_type:complete
MAKKPTLKDLFGVGGDREQVSLDLGQRALNPAVPRGGNYNVVVQSTPKTNQALEFAANLEKGVNLYGNVVDFNVRRAETDIAKLNDTQVAELIAGNDKDALSIFGYNKAYNYGLVKRYYATKKAEIASQIDEMTNNTEDTDILDFKRRLDARKVEMYDVIGEQFKDNRYTTEAHNALFSATVTPLIERAELQFQENQKVAVRAEYLTDSAQILDARDAQGKYVSDMTTALQATKDNLAARNLENNKEKKSIYEDVVRNGIADALLNDDPERARELLKQAGDFQIFKGAKLDRTLLKTLAREIDTAESRSDESISKFLGLIDNQGEGLAALLMTGSDESVLASLRATLKTIGYDDAYIDASLQGFELSGTANQKGAQVMRKIAELQVDEKNQRKINGLGQIIETLGDPRRIATEPADLVTLDDLRRLAPIIERTILANPTRTLSQHQAALKLLLLDESGNPLPIASFATEITSALNKTNWSNPEASSFSRIFKGYTDGKESTLVDEGFTASQISTFEAAMLSEAQRLWDKATVYDKDGNFLGHDRASFDEQFETFSEQLFDDLVDRDNAERQFRTLTKEGFETANLAEEITDAADIADRRKYKYESLKPKPNRADALKDRASIVALEGTARRPSNKRDLLIGSLILYGFPTIESFDPKLLKDTGLTYSDVGLGSEVRSRLELAIDGFIAGDDVTREQEDAIEYWEQYGVFDRADAELILEDQDDFLQKLSILTNSR